MAPRGWPGCEFCGGSKGCPRASPNAVRCTAGACKTALMAKRAAEKAQAGLMLSMVAEKENAAQKAREEAFKKAKEEALAKKKVFGRTVGGYLLSGSTPIFLVSQGSLCCRKEPEDFFYTIVL